jgi:betaine-aldehyde dehydrogenase
MTTLELPNIYGPETTLPIQQNYVGGAFLASSGRERFETRHPGNGRVICEVEVATEADVDKAVSAAGEAFEDWANTPAAARGDILRRAARLLREHNTELAELETLDTGTQLGPLVSREHYEKVLRYMAAAKDSGARHICGGEALTEGDLADGYYVSPAIFSECSDDMSFVREEVFGPLMSVLSFNSENEALDRANNTQFGLSGAVFTKDFSRAHRVANRLQAGSVWINDYNVTPPQAPFGGYKQSGLGRENGLQAIQYYTQVKTIYANLGDVPKTF